MRGGGCRACAAVLVVVITVLAGGCAGTGYLEPRESVTPTPLKVTGSGAEAGRESEKEPEAEPAKQMPAFAPFADSLIGFVPGTADTNIRYLGRLRDGYTVDTLNVILLGDNRPGYRATRLYPEYKKIQEMVSFNPARSGAAWSRSRWLYGRASIPIWPSRATSASTIRHMPTASREHQVVDGVIETRSILCRRTSQVVSAVLNTGDLVEDGRCPAHWERFLDIWTRPVSSRVPYFPIAGNHERTDTPEGLANWRTATGLPIRGDRLYYCFDTADGWLRFIALDSNPIIDPGAAGPASCRSATPEEELIGW